ncbi:MAG: O-antigen ligase family protein [Bdellovibrionales bacterium]|nr:O-antigen ligase family protein [Bdellovibrionales bacterium]
MNASSLSRIFYWVLPLYAVLSLTAMAGMNPSFLVVFLCLLAALIVRAPAWVAPASVEEYQAYRFWGWAVAGTCLLSLIVAKIWPVTYAGVAPDVTAHGFLKIWYMLIPMVLMHGFYRMTRGSDEALTLLQRTFRFWCCMVLFLGVIAVIQYNTGWPLMQVIPTNPTHYHAILFFGHHLSTASIIPFPTFCALAVALGLYTREKRIPRFELIVGLVGLLILFLSYARTAWLSLPIGIALLLARYLSRKQFLAWFGGFTALTIAACFTPAMKERIQNGMGISERLHLWVANIDYFKHNPLTGIGWLKTQEMSEFYFKQLDPEHYHDYFWGHAHSNFFEMLGGTGIIGLIAWLGWSWFTLRLTYRNSRRAEAAGQLWIADLSWGFFVGLLLLHFNGLTNVTFWEGKVMHQQMLAVGLSLIFSGLLARNRAST